MSDHDFRVPDKWIEKAKTSAMVSSLTASNQLEIRSYGLLGSCLLELEGLRLLADQLEKGEDFTERLALYRKCFPVYKPDPDFGIL